jgi:hypothetical protein
VEKKADDVQANPFSLLATVYPKDRQYVEENYHQFVKRPLKMSLNFRIEWPYTTDRWMRLTVFPLEQKAKEVWVAGMVEDNSARKKNIFYMQKIWYRHSQRDAALCVR